ncbi:amidohydrolase family protein [Marinobacterium lutimaris]|uniref:Predicted metal-dependent hydrolase, TIM-barrel fold n=1 Tax=Marinobacterium lutimaris TaxID=568106 RepID=A0A1H5TTA1_9GAMM|nr:amidohydrolase family protein [Marinobacterium lutimaris]SEF65999.1 Predicted metal-dependent hydrolase, TIM-barrel fold [Marinobacterium lutimaris]
MNDVTTPGIAGVDTHAHIFCRDLPLAANRRYAPEYDALVDTWISNIDSCGLSHGVLIQPSFLGTDNSYIEEALRKYPERLRAVAVVDPEISDAELDRLDTLGFVGIRLNLIGKELADFSAPLWQHLFKRLAQLNWQVEIQRGFDDLYTFVPDILASGVNVVIDHFGRPGGAIDPAREDHTKSLELFASEQMWIKLSAAYRAEADLEQASQMLETLKQTMGGVDRCLWGSDWPNTQFENSTNYKEQFAFFTSLVTDAEERRRILVDNAINLFRFNQTV